MSRQLERVWVGMRSFWLRGLVVAMLVFCGTVSPYVAFAQTVEVCNDGVDNDGNGLIDCADPFCSFAANIEKGCRCFDSIDNDGDGKIDAADTECATYYGLSFVGEGSTCSITRRAEILFLP